MVEILEGLLEIALEAFCWCHADSVTARGVFRVLMGIAAIFCCFGAVASAIKSGGWIWLGFAGVGVMCGGAVALRE